MRVGGREARCGQVLRLLFDAWCVVRGAWCGGVVRRRAAEWHDDEVDHPGRSDSRRAESAVTTTVVEGGATADAAAAGARIGGPVGAALFPGVGTVVGGIVGSAIGVRLGGTGGEVLGDELKDVDEGSDFAKGVHDMWKGILG